MANTPDRWQELRETVLPLPSHWKPGSFMYDVAELLAERDALALECKALREALDASVKLQSHYAMLLNMHDGGKRIQFADAEEWLTRLAMSPADRARLAQLKE